MRDLFQDIFGPEAQSARLDPEEAARRSMRSLKRRFYQDAAVRDDPAGFAVVLDGRPIRTPARQLLAAPSRPLAEAMAAEWRAQAEFIDPAAMPMTRLSNSVIDGVAAAQDEVAGEIVKYLGTDLVCYRAAAPEGLVARQTHHWDPVLAWARRAHGAEFRVVHGVVVHVAQPDEAIARTAAAIPREPWRLGAVHAVTTLTGSALLALALAGGDIGRDAAWEAAHVDEDWNMERWGRDDISLARRAYRLGEMTAAAAVLAEV
jgi:chaperone required for assembly of F1-ATPase